jgi:hypothetical protein
MILEKYKVITLKIKEPSKVQKKKIKNGTSAIPATNELQGRI